MTAEEAILARINQGPADSIGLHLAVVQLTGVQPGKESSAWAVTHDTIHKLEAAGKIVRHVSGAYMLPTSAKIEPRQEEQGQTLRPGTVVPKQFQHLVKGKP
jgi:hypothetical protein